MVDPTRLKDRLEQHGELHCIVSDHERELELRRGQVEFALGADNSLTGAFTVESHGERYSFHTDHVVSFYEPQAIWHD